MKNLLNNIRALNWPRVGIITGSTAILLLGVVCASLVYISTDSGRNQITKRINDSLNSQNSSVNITTIEGSLFSEFTVDKITFSDRDGVWLELRHTQINWSPLSLFSGIADFSAIDIESLNLYRQPISSETAVSSSQNPFTIPELPINLNIESYSIFNIVIDQNFANIPTELKSNGAIKLTNDDGILAKANLTSIGQYNDSLIADIIYPSDGSNLNIDVKIQAPNNGLFVSVLGIEARHDLSLEIKGRGPIDDWDGTLKAHAGDSDIIDANFNRSGKSFTLNADMDASEFISEDLNNIIGSKSNLTMSLISSEETDSSDLSVELNTAIATLKASGSFANGPLNTNEKVDLTLEISNTETINKFISPTYLRPFTIDGTVNSLTTNPNITLAINQLEIGHEDIIKSQLTGQVDIDLEETNIVFNTTGKFDELEGTAVSAIIPLIKNGVDWTVNGNFNKNNSLITIGELSLTNEFIKITGNSSFNDESGALTADIKTSAQNLSTIGKVMDIGEKIKGNAELTIALKQDGAEQPLEANISATTASLDLGQDIANAMFGNKPNFQSNLTLMPDGAISINTASLQSEHINFKGDFDISKEQIFNDANFQVELHNLENIDEIKNVELTGNINIDGKLAGNISSPTIAVNTVIEQLNAQGVSFENFAAKLEVINSFDNANGHLTLTSESNLGPLAATSEFITEENIYKIPALKIDLGSYHAYGNFEIEQEKPVTGLLTILTDQQENPESGIGGDITASIKLSNDNNTQHISIDGTLAELAFPLEKGDVLTLKDGKIIADILLTETAPEITINSEINELMHPHFQTKHARLNVGQNNDRITYNMNIEGTDTMPYEMEISGSLLKTLEQFNILLSGSIADTLVEIKDPLTVTMTEDDVLVSPFYLRLGDGSISGSINKQPHKLAISLKADKADLSPSLVLRPEIPLTGLLSGEFEVLADQNTMDGSFIFSLAKIKSKNTATQINQSLLITTSGNIGSTETDITGTIELPELTTANFSAILPLQLDTSTFKLDFVDEKPASGTLTWNGEIRPVWAITNMIDHDLSGNLDASFNFSGNLVNPDIDGELKLENGRYENMQTGFVAADIDMASTIIDRQFTLDKLTANDGEQGAITANGNINIAEDFSYSARANLKLLNTRLIRQPELNVIASSNLEFEKNNSFPKLSGEITVENADIGSVTQGGPTITTLNVREINAEGIEVENNDEEKNIEPIDLDLKFIVPGKLFIRSYGLDSEWEADLNITGTSEKPIVDGTASLIRGFFEFSGKRFNLTRGSLDFPNDTSNDPTIEINAEHSLTDLVANLRIFGKASAPKLEITSTPYLPENEVLSRILFGTSVAELTAVEAVQLATAVHSLSNGGGEGFMGGVRRAIGVDRLSIDNDSSREYGTTITGGKYLTDNVYVEVSTAPATGETATSVEVGLTRNLSLVTRRTLDHDNNLSIRWFWNY